MQRCVSAVETVRAWLSVLATMEAAEKKSAANQKVWNYSLEAPEYSNSQKTLL